MNDLPRHVFTFEKLRVWHDARTLVRDVYRTTASFPNAEQFGLTSQVNRAAVSVAANLAEGSARISSKDQAHFSQLAYSSLMELACLLIIAVDLGYFASNAEQDMRRQIEAVSAQLNALRTAQLRQ